MNTRAYLTILRPWQVIAFAGAEALFGWMLLRMVFPSNPAEVRVVALLVLAPMIVGSGLLWPLEYVLHHGGCALMPGVDRAFARAHARSFVVAATALTAACAWGLSGYPIVLSAGLVVTLLSMPLFFERGSLRWSDSWRMGVAALNAVAAACMLGLDRTTQTVVGLATFVISLFIAVRGFSHCFDRRRILARGRRPYVHYQVVVMAAFGLARLFRINRGGLSDAGSQSREIEFRDVDDSVWSWLGVMFRLRQVRPKMAIGSFLFLQLTFGPVLLAVMAGTDLMTKPVSFATWLQGMAGSLGGPGLVSGPYANEVILTLSIGSMVIAMQFVQTRRFRLPISRVRLADYTWTYSVLMSSAILISMALSLSATFLVLEALVLKNLQWTVVPRFGLIALMCLAALMIALTAFEGVKAGSNAWRRWDGELQAHEALLTMACLGGLGGGLVAAIGLGVRGSASLTGPAVVLLIAGSALIYRQVLRWNFRRCSFEGIDANPGKLT
ncbi:hypothetical protein GALL_223340 [mine drainage metagenome]|uniref:Uncharacterized protein n=1 Tax=mine drainage metagenome TaxID=410659 RepID=A0A1J5RJM8_9ZZZZ